MQYERAYFERGFIAAYAWAATKLPSSALSDAVIDHAWDHRDEGIDEEDKLPIEPGRGGWRCFHCNEHFTSVHRARLHFGRDETSEPACIIKTGAEGSLLKALREAEEAADDAIQAMHAESTDAAKAYHAQRCRHTQALTAAEELGYERGLADGRALSAPPVSKTQGVEREAIEAECAALLAAYLRKEIGRLMQQAEHWATNGKPLAVHHRLMKADDYFQILVLMERDPAKGWKLPFDEIRESLKRPAIYEPGAYPPNADLYRYRDPAFVVAALHPTDQEAIRRDALEEAARVADAWAEPFDSDATKPIELAARKIATAIRALMAGHKDPAAL
ncbi:hypothetical protein COA17_07510 [Sphingomonas ginsenosidimutans]|uniref:Uncharacterized protein n=2 Tax=Sphingomonas ginsenosidimutans TaxID=862134 RepID=A0A2A4HXT6_9SPHN|nr:hypothetical protein COA17_07510 [Sphingomonas ginsenosidimutans]